MTKLSKDCGNILIVAQGGRLQYEAILFAASLRATDPDYAGSLYIAEPQPGPRWNDDPRILGEPTRNLLTGLGATIVPFETDVFGSSYPHGNKIEALKVLPAGEPFIFFDTDTMVLSPLSDMSIDFKRPSASMKRTNTWPEIELYGPGYGQIWKSLYDRFGLDFPSSLDLSHPDEYWQRYMYFNAGWFLGSDPAKFGALFTEYARTIRDDPPKELVCQTLDPWLDQVALPLVIHALGGGRPGPELDGLDGDVTCHWRVLPLLYARENDKVISILETVSAPNKIKKVLKEHDAFKRMIYQGRGQRVRDLFDQDNLPRKEAAIRNKIKKNKLWMR